MKFLDRSVVVAIHDRPIAEFGGATGVRDAGGTPNHPFLDGNGRTARVFARTLLALNGKPLAVERVEAVERMIPFADGTLDEAGFAARLSGQPPR